MKNLVNTTTDNDALLGKVASERGVDAWNLAHDHFAQAWNQGKASVAPAAQ